MQTTLKTIAEGRVGGYLVVWGSQAQRDLQGGLTAMRDHANELLEQDARELVERFGQMGGRKLQLAG